MTLEEINNRILELEEIRDLKNSNNNTLRLELSEKEQQIKLLREAINASIFENTEEYKELEELKIARKWLER